MTVSRVVIRVSFTTRHWLVPQILNITSSHGHALVAARMAMCVM